MQVVKQRANIKSVVVRTYSYPTVAGPNFLSKSRDRRNNIVLGCL